MTTLLALALLAPQIAPGVKYWTLDDFTVGPYTKTLTGTNSDYKAIFGLDKSHCVFGQRRTGFGINYNPNQTSLTLEVGGGIHRLSSPLQVSWNAYIEYGGDGTVLLDLSAVDTFFVDFTTFPAGKLPDLMGIHVFDIYGHDAQNLFWLGAPKGLRFRKSDFSGSVDWKKITIFKFRENFDSLPNPTSYTVTRLYASLKPGAGPPAQYVEAKGVGW